MKPNPTLRILLATGAAALLFAGAARAQGTAYVSSEKDDALTMIDRRFNDLAHWDNPNRDRYTVELDIVTVELQFATGGADQQFPLLEVLDIQIVDRRTEARHHGIVGNNFSSYVLPALALLPLSNEPYDFDFL